MSDVDAVGTIQDDEFHPAARSAYRWLKGFMVTNPDDYARSKLALQMSAESGNRQAEICVSTIERLATGVPVSDRYLLGLCWTILYMHNFEAMEGIADHRFDTAYPKDQTELET